MLLSDRFTRPRDDVIRRKGNAEDSKTRAPVTLFQNPGDPVGPAPPWMVSEGCAYFFFWTIARYWGVN